MDHDENNLCTPKSWAAGTKKKDGFSKFGSISFSSDFQVNHVFTLQGFFAEEKKSSHHQNPFSEALQKSLASWKFSGQICMDFSVGMYISSQTNHCRWPVTKRGNPGWINGPIPFVGSQTGHRYIVRTVFLEYLHNCRDLRYKNLKLRCNLLTGRRYPSKLRAPNFRTLVRTAICAQRFLRDVFSRFKKTDPWPADIVTSRNGIFWVWMISGWNCMKKIVRQISPSSSSARLVICTPLLLDTLPGNENIRLANPKPFLKGQPKRSNLSNNLFEEGGCGQPIRNFKYESRWKSWRSYHFLR